MPAVAKTNDDEIVKAARAIVAKDGAGALSMQAVASAVGLRAPSLYKRFPDRAGLLIAVELDVLAEAQRALERAAQVPPKQRLESVARAYRQFARKHRHLYALVFNGSSRGNAEADAARQRAAQPSIDLFAERYRDPARALCAARVLTAFLHGFVTMENAGEFRLGPGSDDAFVLGLHALKSALLAS